MNVGAPDDSHRSLLIGRTGTGKTGAGIYQLSMRSYDVMPWLAIDPKGERYFDDIPTRPLAISESIPDQPGIYRVRMLPGDERIDGLLMRAHERGNVGIYIDEAYAISQHSLPLRYVLTQGRTLNVPVIACTQRPCWISKFLMSEADFFQVFPVTADDDRKVISQFTTLEKGYPRTLSKYHSYFYDVAEDRLTRLLPVPYGEDVLDIFNRRAPTRHKRL